MAVQMMSTIQRWEGLSVAGGDAKPAAPTFIGSTYYETDTGRTYLWNGVAWVIMPVHILNVQGGAYTIQDLMEEHLANLDFARVQTIASPVTLSAAIQYVYQRAAGAHPFYFAGGFFSWNAGAWVGGETVDINVQTSADGVNWVNLWTAVQLAAAPLMLEVAIPHEAMTALLNLPKGFYVGSQNGVRVGIIQNAVGAGWHVVSHNFVDGIRGG